MHAHPRFSFLNDLLILQEIKKVESCAEQRIVRVIVITLPPFGEAQGFTTVTTDSVIFNFFHVLK